MKRALVLCGGGSKGAYEMGVWTALKELNEDKFDIVCGTSIGALNGVMFVQGAYEECLKLWNETRNDTIMTKPIKIDDSSLKMTLKKMEDLIPFVKSYLQQKGVDITPFKQMMDKYIDPKKVKESKMEFGVVVVNFPSFKPILVNMKEVKDEELRSYVLASCSCFPLFPVCKIGDKNLIDGGYFDNMPIDFALDLGATEIVCVDLNYNFTHKEYLNKPFITYIHPSWNLGGFFLFEEEIIAKNKQLGYNDCMKTFGKFLGFRYTFYKNNIDKDICKNYVLRLAILMKNFRKSKIKSLVKTEEESDMFQILEKETYRSLNELDYYLRALEVAAELFGIDHLKVYRADDLKMKILDAIFAISKDDEVNLLDEYKKIKTAAKRRDYLARSNRFVLMNEIAYQLFKNHKLDDSLIMDLIATHPKVIIIMLLYRLWSDTDAKEEKDFGFEIEFEQ